MFPGGAMLTPIFEKITSWLGIFQRKPKAINDTMKEIQQSNEAARKRQEAEAEAEERVRQAHERELAAAKEREEAAVSASRLLEAATASAATEAQAAAEEARQREAAAKIREEAALAAAEQANNALRQGIRPIEMPTEQQYQDAKERIQYNPEKLHFAVCGSSGSGKSSLINALRGLSKKHKDAAAVDVVETTSQITRYPDPRNELPYSRFVWYDIPGAGTLNVSDWQYFNDQGLFVFDFIVMVYDVRFTKIDVDIMENCYRFNIPVLVVRSKADQHINNMITNDEEDEDDNAAPGTDESQQMYQDVKATYSATTKCDFDKHMRIMAEKMADDPMFDIRDRQMLLSQRVYMVSAPNIRSLVQRGSGADRSKFIDEVLFVEDLLSTAARRRYAEAKWKGPFQLLRKERDAISGAFSFLEIGIRT